MATAKERQVEAELMEDPAYRAAWEQFKRVLRGLVGSHDLVHLQEAPLELNKAVREIMDAVNRNPKLATLVAAAESEMH